jgi:hypothetical protein
MRTCANALTLAEPLQEVALAERPVLFDGPQTAVEQLGNLGIGEPAFGTGLLLVRPRFEQLQHRDLSGASIHAFELSQDVVDHARICFHVTLSDDSRVQFNAAGFPAALVVLGFAPVVHGDAQAFGVEALEEPVLWRTRSGRFLFWFHNNGNKDWSPGTRNPCWLAGGIERDGQIHWSQPEIVLYDPQEAVRISYPDLIEEHGRYWITETQKSVARVHEIDPTLLEGLWNQASRAEVASEGLVDAKQPKLPAVDAGGGFSFDLWFLLPSPERRVLVSALAPNGDGLSLVFENGALVLVANDGEHRATWSCDAGLLQPKRSHHVVVTVDGGPGIVTWIVDGVLGDGGDGGDEHWCGWQRFRGRGETETVLGRATRAASGRVVERGAGLRQLRVYGRALRTSQDVGNFRAGE